MKTGLNTSTLVAGVFTHILRVFQFSDGIISERTLRTVLDRLSECLSTFMAKKVFKKFNLSDKITENDFLNCEIYVLYIMMYNSSIF